MSILAIVLAAMMLIASCNPNTTTTDSGENEGNEPVETPDIPGAPEVTDAAAALAEIAKAYNMSEDDAVMMLIQGIMSAADKKLAPGVTEITLDGDEYEGTDNEVFERRVTVWGTITLNGITPTSMNCIARYEDVNGLNLVLDFIGQAEGTVFKVSVGGIEHEISMEG